ncbi:hypothetical protein CAPTEDRAFT_224741 [Capitella teleta]|uniref:SUEL-type lectin domain-containing protein n=1 Tax=Capitella teleta TaxID=283909 RepID=R7UNR5_CAPTE|nr:hypothetical protein CAPTEDRAFT_224741 [Capitella teleta]|eukprot:ELU07870.1 hypothetical protein CAPTEDRAFT_224741 [Capitella teleta]
MDSTKEKGSQSFTSLWHLAAMKTYIFLVLGILLVACDVCCGVSRLEESRTICEHEEAFITCPRRHVIIIKQAIYGHLGISACVDFNTGHFGCNTSIIDSVNPKCTGHNTCRISEEDVRKRNPCRKGLDVFISLAFLCIPAEHAMPCRENPLGTSALVISSGFDPFDDACARPRDFQFRIKRGQQVTLILESLVGREEGIQIGTLLDENSAEQKFIVLNTVAHQNVTIGTSLSSNVVVTLFENTQAVYLIHIKASGCEDLVFPAPMWVERQGDVTTVGCHDSQLSWTLRCNGMHWKGVVGNCSLGKERLHVQSSQMNSNGQLALPNDVILVAIAAATVIMALLIVTIGYVCYKRVMDGFEKVPTEVVYDHPRDLTMINNNNISPENFAQCTWRVPRQFGMQTSRSQLTNTLSPRLPRRNEDLVSISQ